MSAKRPTMGTPWSYPDLIPSSRPEDPFTSPTTTTTTSRHPVLPAFDLRSFLARRTSSEILADLDPASRLGARPSTPSPTRPREPPIPRSHPSTPDFLTPESTADHTFRIRLVELEASPSSSRSRRSVDTEGDVKMLNGTFTTPERRQMRETQERDEVLRRIVTRSVHDNFEFERPRLVDEVARRVLVSLGDQVEWSVRERVDRVLCAAAGEPPAAAAGDELEQVVAVREQLKRMSDEARVRVFCTEEMVGVLRRLVEVVDLEMRMEEPWTFVGGDAWD